MTALPAATRPAVASTPGKREPLSALGKLTAASLAAGTLSLFYVQVFVAQAFRADLTVFAIVYLVAAGFVAGIPVGRWRWTPLLAVGLGLLVLTGNGELLLYELMHPGPLHVYGYFVVAVGLTVIAIVAGLLATVQNYRYPPAERRTPRWLPASLVAVAALSLGAMLVGALPRAAGAGVSPEVLAELPAVRTSELTFEMPDLTIRAGETVALRLENESNIPHTFTIEGEDVNVEMPGNSTGLALFRLDEPGTYTYYCEVPGHRMAGMEGTLVVVP